MTKVNHQPVEREGVPPLGEETGGHAVEGVKKAALSTRSSLRMMEALRGSEDSDLIHALLEEID